MARNSDNPIKTGINIMILIILLVVFYSVYTTMQGGDPSGVIQTFSDVAQPLFGMIFLASVVVWILSEIT